MNNCVAPEDIAATFPTKPLSACLESVKVPAKIPRSSFLSGGKLPIISQESDFINGYWNNEADAIHVDDPVVVFGDHTQVLKLIDFDFVVGADGVKILKPKEFLDAAFLRYVLEANPIPSLGYARHYRHISGMDIPLPPLEEQTRIVVVLDQAFAALNRARANIEVNIETSRRLFEASLETTFSEIKAEFGSKPVSGLCTSIIDCVNKTAPKIESPTPFIMVRTSNVRHGRLDLSDVKYVSEETYLQWTRRQTPAIGDVLLTREAPLGEAAIVDTPEKIFLGQRIVSYRTNPEVLLARYLLLAFRSPLLKKQFEHLGAGATVQHMRVPQSKELKIPLASMSHQQKVVVRLTSMEKKADQMELLYSKQLTDLANLRQSLLQKAFSGQLT